MTPESTTLPLVEIALKYIWSPAISTAKKALPVSNPFAVSMDLFSMSPARSFPPEPTMKYTIPCWGLIRS